MRDDIKIRCLALSLVGGRDALGFLSTEGHVYTTIDDDHFKATHI